MARCHSFQSERTKKILMVPNVEWGMLSIDFDGSAAPGEKSMTRNAKLQYPAAKPIGIDYLPVIDLHVTDGSDPEQRESCLHGRTKLLFEDQLESLKTRRNDLRGSDHQSG